jgi:hypothetical protein
MQANMLKFALLLVAISVGSQDVRATEKKLSSAADIERLALAIALTDFPIQQGKMVDVIGDPSYSPMIWGSKAGDGPSYQLAALTDPKSPTGFFAVRCVYKKYDHPLPPEEIEVLSEEIIFIAPHQMTFVYEQKGVLEHMLPELKVKMKKMGLKPREFAALFYKLCEDDEKGSPNQAAQSTTPSVTPPAGQEARQP